MNHVLYKTLLEKTIMQILLKIIISTTVILLATSIAKKYPSIAGLIAVMPLAGAMVLGWVYFENNGDSEVMQEFTKGALGGILPSILFYLTALICFKKQFSLPVVLLSCFGIWLVSAMIHQKLLR
jgi:uncharacterized membrane protein (GlpM family)